MNAEQLHKLRHKKPLNFFCRKTKTFVKIQFNHKEKAFVCWERWVSADRQNWINHNLYLSLKDINNIINSFKTIPQP